MANGLMHPGGDKENGPIRVGGVFLKDNWNETSWQFYFVIPHSDREDKTTNNDKRHKRI